MRLNIIVGRPKGGGETRQKKERDIILAFWYHGYFHHSAIWFESYTYIHICMYIYVYMFTLFIEEGVVNKFTNSGK